MSEKFQHFSKNITHISNEAITNLLQHDIKTKKRTKNGWYIFIVVALINGITTGFLGFPDIGDIASVDNISNLTSGFSLYDKIFMMVSTSLMMWPFFQQIFAGKVYEKVQQDAYNKREEIINDPDNFLRQGIKHSKALFIYDIISTIIVTAVIGSALGIAIQYGTALISFFIVVTLVSLSLLKIGRDFLKSYVKNNIATEHYKEQKPKDKTKVFLANTQLSRFKSHSKTKSIIRQAISEIKFIQHTHPNQEEVYNALFNSIYEVQLQRYRMAILKGNSETTLEHMSITNMARKHTTSHLSKLYMNLAGIDNIVASSPLLVLQKKIYDVYEKDSDKYKNLLKEISSFRASIINKGIVIKPETTVTKLVEGITDPLLIDAIIAEIEEEKGLYSKDHDDHFAFKLMQRRFENRNNFEFNMLLELEQHNEKSAYFWVGNIIGTLNALVNGAITAAVVGKLIMFLFPILFGFTISNPITLGIIFASTAIVGFYSSFSLTRKSMVRVFKKMEYEAKKDKVVINSNMKNNNYALKTAIIVAAIGLGLLSGLQVYMLLGLYYHTAAIYAGVIVCIASMFAIYSLFTDYANAQIKNLEEKDNFIATYFPKENEKNKVINKVYSWNYALSLIIGVAVATLIHVIYPHIIVCCTLGMFAVFLSGYTINTVTNDQYKKPNVHKLNMYAKSGACITMLYSGCLMASVASGIFKLSIISFMPANLMFAVAIGLIVAALYFPYVWNTATAPEINFTDTIIDIGKNDNQDKSLLSENITLITFLFSLIICVSIFFTISTFIPNIAGIAIGLTLALTVQFLFSKDYFQSAKLLNDKGAPLLVERQLVDKVEKSDMGRTINEAKPQGRLSPSSVAAIESVLHSAT